MTDHAAALDRHLNECLAERHGVMAKAGSLGEFRFEVRRNPDLMEEAKRRLASFDEGVLQRDHISRIHKQILLEIVGDAA